MQHLMSESESEASVAEAGDYDRESLALEDPKSNRSKSVKTGPYYYHATTGQIDPRQIKTSNTFTGEDGNFQPTTQPVVDTSKGTE
jgi:hypothetical protein